MTKLPHLASKAAVGFAATVSSRGLPCFLSAATSSRIATSMSRNSLSSALLLTGFPCPGMMMVLSVVAARFSVGCRDHAVDAAVRGIVDERIDTVPICVGRMQDIRFTKSDGNIDVSVSGAIVFQADRRAVEL